MDKLTIALIIIWMILAVVNIVGIFVPLHAIFGIMFGILNLGIIISLIPLLHEAIKLAKAKQSKGK